MKSIVFVKADLEIDVLNVEDTDFANMSEVNETTQRYLRTLKDFEAMQAELVALIHGNGDAASFLKRRGAWLANLSRTGFAIDYTQFVKK